MKKYITIALLALFACNSNTEKKETAAADDKNALSAGIVNNPHTAEGIDTISAAMKPVIAFKDTVHDFGKVHENEVVQYNFAFTNTGKSPLIISAAAASCGCTVADYPHDPVAPGESGIMKVTFNTSGKSGHQEKSVSLHTNTVIGSEVLYIKADVAADKK